MFWVPLFHFLLLHSSALLPLSPLAVADSNINLIFSAMSSHDPGVIPRQEWSTVLSLKDTRLSGARNALWLPSLEVGTQNNVLGLCCVSCEAAPPYQTRRTVPAKTFRTVDEFLLSFEECRGPCLIEFWILTYCHPWRPTLY